MYSRILQAAHPDLAVALSRIYFLDKTCATALNHAQPKITKMFMTGSRTYTQHWARAVKHATPTHHVIACKITYRSVRPSRSAFKQPEEVCMSYPACFRIFVLQQYSFELISTNEYPNIRYIRFTARAQ